MRDDLALAAHLRTAAPLTVADYMAAANAAYYARRDPLGPQGDFITAPEISQLFGEMLGLWLAARWLGDGGPDPCLVVELGPGRGTLMADALRATARVPGFHRALRLHLIETSPCLRAAQAGRLAAFTPVWHRDMTTLPHHLPHNLPLYLVANEFLDALPIRQFIRTPQGWQERAVIPADDGPNTWQWILQMPQQPPAFPDLPEGSLWEASPACCAVVHDIATRIAQDGGAAVVVDYGYTGPTAGETLQAVKDHAPWSVLHAPGCADLSAHVDFGPLIRVATAAGCQSALTPQGAFLHQIGIESRLMQLLATASATQKPTLAAGYRRLVAPSEMGLLFKVLTLAPAGTAALA